MYTTHSEVDTGSGVPVKEPQRQLYYIELIKDIINKKENETGRKQLMYVNTFGCQMNAHDSEKLEGMLLEMGYGRAEKETEADFIIYNTCCVRENAENKVYGNLGMLKPYKKKKPDTIIALCGCMMQQSSVTDTIRSKYSFVDIVFGTYNLYRLPELLYSRLTSGEQVCEIMTGRGEIVENLPSVRHFRYKASVNIMYGCDNFCSYCIVPYVRGRERSRRPEDIIAEIKSLVADGVCEVTLLGQNVNSYGKGLEEKISFAELLRLVNDIDGIKRIRFMTSHPKDLSDELIYAMRDCKKVCRHIHLPFQAGNNDILRRMNRHYTKEDYLGLVEKLRENIPDIGITTDIMVGFPGEYNVDDTLDIIRKARFSGAFTFIYSKRNGTPAAVMEDQVDPAAVKKNFDSVLGEVNRICAELNLEKVGKVFEVLAEGVCGQDERLLSGRLEDNTLIHFEGDHSLIGSIVNVRVTESRIFYLMGKQEDL